MLLQPFLASVILTRGLAWGLVPAGAAALLLFAIREPLVVIGRQVLVWRDRHAEADRAAWWVAVEAVLLVGCGVWLAHWLAWTWLTGLGLTAAGLTLGAVWMIVRNRRREVWLQVSSAVGLSCSALLPPLVLRASLPDWGLWLCGLVAVHNVAEVLVVHARLELRAAARKDRPASSRKADSAWRRALAGQALPVAAAAASLWDGRPLLAAAPLLSAAVHVEALRGLRAAGALELPLRKVGLRALALSLVYTAITIAGLW